jgi:hypothetical protein
MVRQPDATMQATPQDNQLMSEHRVLRFKPQLRLEWRGHDGQNETEQPDHSPSLGDSVTSSTRIRFSVHTAVVHHDEMRKRPENRKAGHPGLPDHDQREREQQRQHNCRANAAGNPRELPLVCIEELHGDADPVRPACSRDTNEPWRSNRRPKSGPSPQSGRGGRGRRANAVKRRCRLLPCSRQPACPGRSAQAIGRFRDARPPSFRAGNAAPLPRAP